MLWNRTEKLFYIINNFSVIYVNRLIHLKYLIPANNKTRNTCEKQPDKTIITNAPTCCYIKQHNEVFCKNYKTDSKQLDIINSYGG